MSIEAEQNARNRESALLDLQAKQQAIESARVKAAEDARKSANEQGAATMKADALQWTGDKTNPQYGVRWNALPEHAKAHFGPDVYGENAAKAAEVYNEAATQNGVVIPGLQIKSATVTDDGKVAQHYDATPPAGPQFDEFTTPEEVIAKIPANESGTAQQLADYKIPITALSRMPSDARMRILNAAKVFNPDFDVKEYNNLNNARKAYTTGTQGQNITAINTAIGHLGQLSKLSKALNNRSVPMWNTVANAYERETGNPNITQFDQTKEAVASELAKVFKGSGVTSEAQMKEWRDAINSSMSPDQLRHAISNAVHLMGSRVQELDRQWGQLTKAPKDYRVLSDNNKRILSEIGFDPSEMDPTGETPPQNPAATEQPAAPAGAPQPGAVVKGYRFKGGNPGDKNDWEPAQ
jgi:hypothetical protein